MNSSRYALLPEGHNEGLAEYSSFTFASDRFGPKFRQHLLQQYLNDASGGKMQLAITDTDANSPVRYVNRYEKTTLLFCILEKQFSRKTLFKTLRILFNKFKGSREAKTETFLKIVHKNMGADAENLMKDYLTKPWSKDRIESVGKILGLKSKPTGTAK